MTAALVNEYYTEWHLDEVAKWGATTKAYPSGTIVEIKAFGGTGKFFVVDTFTTPEAHEAGLWVITAPLAGARFETAKAAAAAADATY